MIILSHVNKIFGSIPAVEDISLTIKPGEILGLLGPNGAGKTTTIRIMAGILPPTKGTIEINHHNFIDQENLLKSQIGYLPENNPLYDDLTVEEHLKFYGKLKGLNQTQLTEAIIFATQKTGISEVFYRLIGELSKGFRQRVGLAQAILSKPEILLLDEPTEGLDPNQRQEIQQLLTELKKDRTVIVSSHVLSEISKLASRVVIINQGKVVADGSPQNLAKKQDKAQIVEVEINGKAVLGALKKIPEISQVTPLSTNNYRLEAKTKEDVRPLLFKFAQKNHFTLLGMKQINKGLEEVFSELTKQKN